MTGAICALGLAAVGLTLVCIWGLLILIFVGMWGGGPYP
jgi:hypothetical protein